MAIDPKLQLPGTPRTANEKFLDALIRHQIFLQRMSGSVRNDVIELLNATEQDVLARINARLIAGEGPTTEALKRAESLIRDITDIRSAAWNEASALWVQTLNDVVAQEVEFLRKAVDLTLRFEFDTVLPPQSTLRALVRERPFEGKLLSGWANKIRSDDINRIGDQIRIGIVQGEPTRAIATRLIGTARLKGAEGVTQIARRDAEALTRTAVSHFANTARGEFFNENADLFEDEAWVATLDSRTCPTCMALDGQRFPVGEGRQAPAHWSCRCLRVAVIGQDLIGNRPAKASTEKQLLREYAEKNKLGKIRSRDDLPRGTKGDFDAFSRRRVRELTGIVPAKTTYQDWLGTQSREFQADVLGKTRAKLFRDGGLKLDKFTNRAGDEFPLRELAKREAAAFRAAGLDPEDF